jgi:hypothetical protein
VPNETPVTIPEIEPTVATSVLLLVQVPPVDVVENVVVAVTQTVFVPVTGAGVGFTVSVSVFSHDKPVVSVMIVVPAEMPVTTPETESIVATSGLLLCQMRPVSELVNVVVRPTHTVSTPVIVDATHGGGLLVT